MVSSTLTSGVWFLWLTAFCLLLFLRGFLLTKVEIERHSLCSDYGSGGCWSKPLYKRAVLVLVDALRHDFTLYNESVAEPKPWQNHMPIFSELRRKYPSRTRHLEFIADPPSATFLRLKGLTTGGLPTFVDLGSNFGASEITEDSWVKQLSLNGKKLVLIGDDTWMHLYSRYFHRALPFPSFDVWDLHTVDNGVWQHLLPQMRTPDWDVIVAHFLGVDHAGHRYHVNHPELAGKLGQVNTWVGEIVGAVGEDTVLFVFGDHGMTTSGDHGGETRDEVTSTLFVYSGGAEIGQWRSEEERGLLDPERVFQTDIVPTLAMLLGVPIPYSSLGTVIPSLFIQNLSTEERVNLQHVLHTNVNQVFRYLETYSMISSEFSSSDVSKIKKRVTSINGKFNNSSEKYNIELVADMLQTIRKIRDLCSNHWAQFNLPVMSLSLLVMLLVTVALLLLPGVTVRWWCWGPVLPVLLISCDKLSLWTGVTQYVSVTVTLLSVAVTFYHPLKEAGSVVIYSICKAVTSSHKARQYLQGLDYSEVLAVVLVSIMSIGFTTNSYVLVEDYISIFFFTTLVIVNYLRRFGLRFHRQEVVLSVVCCVSSRFSATFFGCRDEQFWCTKTWWLNDEVDEGVRSSRYGGSVVVYLGLMYGLYRYQKDSGGLVRGTVRLMYSKIQPVQAVVVVVYWALSVSDIKVLSDEQLCYLPRTVYILSILSICIVLYSPSTILLQSSPSIPPCVQLYGAVRCYTTPLLALYTALLPPCALLLQHHTAPVLALLTLQLLCVARLTEGGSIVFKTLICHVVMVQYFYATGHQAAIQAFDWNAAFVGFTSHGSHVVLPVLMISLRTLMSPVLVTLLLPVVVLSCAPPEGAAQQVDLTGEGEPGGRGESGGRGELRYFTSPTTLHSATTQMLHSSTALCLFKCTWACLACFIHRRHLMIWNIFTPRMIAEMCFTAAVSTFLTIVLVVVRRTDGKLRKVLGKLNKSF